MAEHTQASLIVTDDGAPNYLDGVEAQYSLDANGSWIAFVKEGVDARRLAACWNACAGISTDELEEIARTGGMLGPREDVARIAKQRDDLLEALKDALGFLEAVCFNTPNPKKRKDYADAATRCRAAIAKVTGEQQ